MRNMSRSTLSFWLILIVLFFGVMNVFSRQIQPNEPMKYSEFLDEVLRDNVQSVTIDGSNISGLRRTKSDPFAVTGPEDLGGVVAQLKKNDAIIEFKPKSVEPWYYVLIGNLLPVIVIVALWVFFIRQMQMGAGKGMSFGKSRAKLLNENTKKITFADVAGIDEARSELQEIVDFLKDPKKFTRLGGRIPKGVLLVGSPGTGKTLLARAIAGEAGVPFFSISGSDFVEMFVGVGASRVRDLFVQGKKNAPCLIFIDEIDAVGRHRGAGMGGGHDEREQTLNQLLVEMDGFEGNEGVILIAATNRPDVLDPALLRPGRFDRRVVVNRPDLNGRLGILKVHVKKTPLSDDVDLEVIARGTPGFSGADIEILVNEAAIHAARFGKDKVSKDDFEYAKDKVMMGAERRSMLLSDKEKKATAIHEAGHALVAKLLKNTDPVHKLTIVPRGMALGLMQQLPERDKHTYSKDYWMDQLVVFFGGKAAEEIVLGEMNTGASSDLERATSIVRKMVCEWGMSSAVGPVCYQTNKEHVFLGREFGQQKEHSETTQVEIDREVRRIIEDRFSLAKKLINENLDTLTRLSNSLFVKETLDAAQIEAVFNGGDLSVETPVTPV
jgi:cell division protease FtsH